LSIWPPEVPTSVASKRGGWGQKGEDWKLIAREMQDRDDVEQSAQHFRTRFDLLKEEVQKRVVGHTDLVEHVITAMVAGGHVLLESAAGRGKTLLVQTLANALVLQAQRIPFTSDLSSTDLIGINLPAAGNAGQPNPGIEFSPGPIFCNLLLADQIHRAPPKTQAALLEAMQEKWVTVEGQTRLLAEPFFVLATQDPLEEGPWLLSQAQRDRFFFSVSMGQPTLEELETILERTAGGATPATEPVFSGEDLILMRDFAQGVEVKAEMRHQIAEVIMATHPKTGLASSLAKKCIRSGAGPRAAQALMLAAQIRAVREGRFHVLSEDVLAFATAVLRHRVTLNSEAQKSGVEIDEILEHSLQELRQRWEE